MAIIKDKVYFFLTPSVFKVASKNNSNNCSIFLLKSVLLKLRYREKINPHIVYFLLDEVESIKTEFGDKFDALLQVGENMFFPVFNEKIKGSTNERILYYATDKDGEIFDSDTVKIICGDTETENYFKTQIGEHNFPIESINIDKALEDITKIEEELKKGNSYPCNGETKNSSIPLQ
jgi:hypothetical protein